MMRTRALLRLALALASGLALSGAMVGPIGADAATVTRGTVHAFATAAGPDISGHATMIRTADGTTIVVLHVEGLAPDTTYGAHVHKQACADGDADGHYRFDPAGPAAPDNEIWPGFSTNGAGIGNGRASVAASAGPAAVSVVVHAPGGAKIACADLR